VGNVTPSKVSLQLFFTWHWPSTAVVPAAVSQSTTGGMQLFTPTHCFLKGQQYPSAHCALSRQGPHCPIDFGGTHAAGRAEGDAGIETTL
jgi:hypothetical protein